MSHKAAKQLLRKQMKDKIKMMTTEEKQRQSASVSSKLLGGLVIFFSSVSKLIYSVQGLKEFQSANSVAIFLR